MNDNRCRKGRRLGVAGLWMLVLIALPSPAKLWAHSDLVTADPAPGALLTTAPTEIRLTFGEPNDPWSRILLFAPGFRSIPGVVTRVNPEAPEQLIARLPQLAPDTYTVQWIAVTTDKHVVRGSYTFGVKQQNNWYLWLSAAATLAIWGFLLAGGPWRKRFWQRKEQKLNFWQKPNLSKVKKEVQTDATSQTLVCSGCTGPCADNSLYARTAAQWHGF